MTSKTAPKFMRGDVVSFDLKKAARDSRRSYNKHAQDVRDRGFSGDDASSSGIAFMRDNWNWPTLSLADYRSGLKCIVAGTEGSSDDGNVEYKVTSLDYGVLWADEACLSAAGASLSC